MIFTHVPVDWKLNTGRDGDVFIKAEDGGSEKHLIASTFCNDGAMMLHFIGMLAGEFCK